MKSNLKILVKNYFLCFVGSLFKKQKTLSTKVATILLVLGAVLIEALYGLQAWSMFYGLGALGLNDLCMFHGIMIVLTVALIISIMRVSGKQTGNDTELLLSLPIKKRDVIIAKTISKYLFDFMFVFMLYVPFLVMYQAFTGFSIITTLCGALICFILPFLSLGITFIYDFIILNLFNKSKYSSTIKSMVTTVIFIVIMALMMVKTFNYASVAPESMEAYFSNRFFTHMFLKATIYHDIMSILFSIVLCAVPFVVGILLFAKDFGKTHIGYQPKNTTLSFSKATSDFGALFKKEVKTYFSTPAYLINTIIGPIVILILGVVFAILGPTIRQVLGDQTFTALVCLGFCGATSLTVTTSCSISLEGKNFWILKTSPLKEKSLFLSKILLNVLLVSPFVLISSIILAIASGMPFVDFIFVVSIPIMLNVGTAFLGLFINLCLPRFDWIDETHVVKQSLSVLLGMVAGMLLTFAMAALLILVAEISLLIKFVISAAVCLVFMVISIILLLSKGVKIFRKIEC